MSDAARDRASWGRIGGLTAWARNEPQTMLGPAHRGFRARFLRLVDPDGVLDPAERAVRADRARRAHMLTLAAKSAETRRRRKAAAAIETPATATEGRRARVDRPSSG